MIVHTAHFSLPSHNPVGFAFSPYRGNRQTAEKKRRRKVKQEGSEEGEGEEMDVDDENDDVEEAEDDLENLALSIAQSGDSAPSDAPMKEDDSEPTASTSQGAEGGAGVFTVTIGPQSGEASAGLASGAGADGVEEKLFVPSGRMKPCMAVKNGVLYLYGGTFEDGDRQVTLSDFYALDMSKLETWRTIIAQNIKLQVWWGVGGDCLGGCTLLLL